MECFNCVTPAGSFCPPANGGCGPDMTPNDVVAASEQAVPDAATGRRLQAAAKKSNKLNRFVVDGNGRTLAGMALTMKARAKCLKAANPHVKDVHTPVASKIRVPVKCLTWPKDRVKAAAFSHPAFQRKSAPRRRAHGPGRGRLHVAGLVPHSLQK